jgi:hypothetical protein
MTGRLYPIPSAPAPRTKTAPTTSADFPSVNSILENFWCGVSEMTDAAEDFYSRVLPLLQFGAFFPSRRMPPALGVTSSLNLPEKANTFSGPFAGLIHTTVFTFGAFAARFFNVSPSSTILDASPRLLKSSGRVL